MSEQVKAGPRGVEVEGSRGGKRRVWVGGPLEEEEGGRRGREVGFGV